MEKVLIVIHDLEIGGAQKSLVNFLNCLDRAGKNHVYDIRLRVLTASGVLFDEVPEWVKRETPGAVLRWFSSHFDFGLLRGDFCWRGLLGELCWLVRSRLNLFLKNKNKSQKMWECWKHFIPCDPEEYDVAISYLDGGTNYYVMDKIRAKKKVLWVHSEYQKQGYVREYDKPYFELSDAIITISEQCRQCILNEFPQLSKKLHVLQNITSYDTVLKKSRENLGTEFADEDLKLLSVGRLHEQKGFDIAVQAAALLKKAQIPFMWLVVGEGPEHGKLQQMIDELGLTDCMKLVGERGNPYVYMQACTLLVQPSRVEGKSIVLDEAKMLCKPILATNYATVGDAIDHGVDGYIVEMTPAAVSEGIVKLWTDVSLRNKIAENLNARLKGNEEELNKYIKIMLR